MGMKLKKRVSILLWLLGPVLLVVMLKGSMGAVGRGSAPPNEDRWAKAHPTSLIDDFSDKSSTKKLGTQWEFISDRAMGGASSGKMEFAEYDGRSCLHVTGWVPGANNGGSIQARIGLAPRGGSFDARNFKGIKLSVKGNGQPYALALQTNDTRLARQFYEAAFATNGAWQEIEIPFVQFKPNALTRPLNARFLKTVAVAATGREFAADIFVDDIAFYGDTNMDNPPGDVSRPKLTAEEERVILHKGTEAPFTGKYYNFFQNGTYTCKRCGAKLFESSSKFPTTCGWPSFDDQIKGAVTMTPDADGVRTEITCSNCGAHLGHVFAGEHLTPKNTRYCVNSISMNFVPAAQTAASAKDEVSSPRTERAIFASGCFWGTEYYLQKAPGVLSTTVGYTGGHVDNPTYKQVCTDKTGHAEAVEVIYDPSKTSYEQLARLFFETHDFTQLNRQGPDIGKQYRSAIFYLDEKQKEIATGLVHTLKNKGFDVKTQITPAGKFWPAEQYHQDYYKNNGKTPYCHVYRKIF